MISIIPNIDRMEHFWDGIDNKKVGEYIKLLKQLQKHIKSVNGYNTPHMLRTGKDGVEQILHVIIYEIEYCEFYFEYKKKARAEDFNKWKFYKNADRPDINYEWARERKGDCWIKHNGRIMAIIDINNKNGAMTKISLELSNDSDHLTFFDYSNTEEFKPKNLKNEDSINKYVQELKDHVDTQLSRDYLFPRYMREKQNFELLEELLHID